ncbi:hypothetical protein HYW94_03390 [Candidatus Uhrbacteria bacterium]|nr:hypothetical protein [Candidatus Uhrbacteria bacterium]
MDMSEFNVRFVDPLPVPESKFYGVNAETEVKKLKGKLKGLFAEIKKLKEKIKKSTDPSEREVDEQRLKKLEEDREKNEQRLKEFEERSRLEKKIKDLKKNTKERQKKDDEEAPYDVSMDYDKEKLKKLEEEKHRKPTVPALSRQEHTMWKFFLPRSYSNSSMSENTLSDFPHTLPYELRKKWTEYKRTEAFKDFQLRASHPSAYPQYFALFGWRDSAYWLIAYWTDSQIETLLSLEEIQTSCLEQIEKFRRARMVRNWGAACIGALALFILFLGLPSFNWSLIGIGIILACLFIAIMGTWKTLEIDFSLEEEDGLIAYLGSKTPS